MFFLKFASPLIIITANFGNTNRSRKTFLKSWNVRIILEYFRYYHFVEVMAANLLMCKTIVQRHEVYYVYI